MKTFSLLVCGCYLLFTERIPQDLFNFSTARNIVILATLHSRKNQLDFAPSPPAVHKPQFYHHPPVPLGQVAAKKKSRIKT